MIGLKKPELLYITDEHGARFFGGNQYWYPKGDFAPGGACGATTASNLIAYILRTRQKLKELQTGTNKAEFIEFMKKVYRFFPPSIIGLHSPFFLKGMAKLTKEYKLPIAAKALKVPILRKFRPSFAETAGFIRSALYADTPVAYLILSNGGVANLYNWHWITIIELDEEDKKIRILDNTVASWVELDSWLKKSRLGGSFIRLTAE